MKMVKSLLLGSAAGLVAVTAGQAADLPVKAKPVEYVKVCSLYGAGFYYMPGTEMCIKIGGWVRAEATNGGSGSLTWGPYNANSQQRTTNNLALRARGYITADAREQTAYGTARAYIAVGLAPSDTGLQTSTPAGIATTFSANRAFLQFAGFTGGLTLSFYDFYSGPAASYRSGYFPNSDTGDGGWIVFGYTAQFGNGFSGTVSAEQRRMTQIINGNCAATGTSAAISTTTGAGLGTPTCGTFVPGGFPTADTAAGDQISGGSALSPGDGAYGGLQVPDFVANLRIDQAWGGGQLMGAIHEVNASYYGTTATGAPSVLNVTGHPSDAWGFAAGAGLRINFPMFAKGDYFQSQFNYTQGALRYLFQTPNTNWGKLAGGSEAYGVLSDCVYGGIGGTATSCELTTAWGVNASYEHYWTPAWHQSFVGAYYQVQYDGAANAMLCQAAGMGTTTVAASGGGTAAVAAGACNNNWTTWTVGSRLQWDVTKSFYLGVEALYSNLHSGTPAGGSGGAIGSYTFGSATFQEPNQDNWAFTFRAHKDFLP